MLERIRRVAGSLNSIVAQYLGRLSRHIAASHYCFIETDIVVVDDPARSW